MKYCKFIEDYRTYTSENETPEIVHLWCGLSALAGAAEKRLWLDRAYFNIYLNLYIILVGPPGVINKSTSMGLAGKMLKEIKHFVLEDSVLKEKIIAEMEEKLKTFKTKDGRLFRHCSVTYLADELNVLLSSGVDMVKFLVTIFSKEGAYHYKTKNSGVYEVVNPFLNLIAAAVPEWFGRCVASDMTSTGFLARNIIVYEDEKRGSYSKPVLKPEQIEARKKCISTLKTIQNRYGALELSSEAETYYDEWYNEQITKTGEDYRMIGYYERKAKVHVLKVAALMALGDESEIVEKSHLEMAIDILEKTERKMRSAYLIAGGNKLAPFITRILSMLDSSPTGRLPMIDVARATFTDITPEETRTVVEQLEDMGLARKGYDKQNKAYFLEKL